MASKTSRRQDRTGPRKWTLLVGLVAIAVVITYAAKSSGPDANPNVKVVRIDLSDRMNIHPELLEGGQEHFSTVMDRLSPYAAINGTFYDENMKPLGDILINGKLVNKGAHRHALAITKSGKVSFIQRGKNGFNWSGYWSGLASGPRLVHNGKIALDPVADGFTSKSLTIEAWRSGVGLTDDGKLLLVTVKESITLEDFAKVMLALGAVEAVNLDGGGACALYHKGKYLAAPTKPITNLLVVYNKDNRH